MRDRLDALTAGAAGAPLPMARRRPKVKPGARWWRSATNPPKSPQMLKPFAGSGGSTEDLIRRALQGAVRPQ